MSNEHATSTDRTPRTKTIVIEFTKELGLPPETLTVTDGKAGYRLSSAGEVPSYIVFAGRRTKVYPAERIHCIDLDI